MYAVQTNAPQPLSGWRPAAPNMGWRPPQPSRARVGQAGVSISESARVLGAMLVGVAAGVSGGLLVFANGEKPRPVLKGIGWTVLGLGFLTVVVNFFRVVSTPDSGSPTVTR